MKMLNVRWRLTLWYGMVLVAIVVGFGLGVYLMMGRHLMARTDFELDEELTELALEVQLAPDVQNLKQQLHRRFFRHASYDFQVSGLEGAPLFRSERLGDVMLPRPEQDGHAPSGPTMSTSPVIPGIGEMRVASRRAAGRSGDYLVQVAIPLAPIVGDLQAVRAMLLTAGSLAIVAALIGGYLLARRALAPVDRMTTLAELITGTRLDSRLEIANPDDELGRLARTINSMLNRLQQSVGGLRRFTADAAHELRTPLAVLRTEAEVALRAPRSADEYRRVVEVTLGESQRLTQLVERLLELSRRDCGLQPMRREQFPLGALLTDVAQQFRPVADQKGISLKVEAVGDQIIEGDDIQLNQLLFNLLDNAIKFTNRGGRVTVSSEPIDGRVQVTISDTGIGISQTDLPHVFDRFYRADISRNGQTGGAGLGLSISKTIVEAHQGTIHIESAEDSGTMVQVRLPPAPAHSAD